MARMPFERKLEGLICSDPKISLFVWLRTLAASGIFWLLFFAIDHIYGINMKQLQLALGKVQDVLYKKSNWLERILVKTIMRTPRGMMARSVLLIFYKELEHALTLTAFPRGVRMAVFHTESLRCDLLFACSSIK
jgi:hypothetical protein